MFGFVCAALGMQVNARARGRVPALPGAVRPRWNPHEERHALHLGPPVADGQFIASSPREIRGGIEDCSRATGFIQPVPDEVMQGFVDGLQLGLHATYPAPDVYESALASAPDRHSFASCDSADCPAPPHSRSKAVTCRPET